MELWIRSQNKIVLMKVDEICYAEVYKGEHSLWYRDILLGKYDTKERALEVLDEIEKLIKPITIFQNCQVDKSTIEKIKEIGYCMVNDDARVEQISQAFYQMPED